MSERNKALVRRFYEEVLNARNVDAIDDLCDAGFVDHSALPGQAPGRQGMKDSFSAFARAFPDMRVEIADVIAEGDLVAARFSGEGTHLGELFGTPATGRKIRFNAIDIIRIRNGKAVEAWHQGDDILGLMQLGVTLPVPSGPE